MIWSFYEYAEISKLNPQTRYLPENVNIGMFENGYIWRGDLENEFSRKLVPWIGNLADRMGLKSIIHTFRTHFRIDIGHIDESVAKPKFSAYWKISAILKIEIPSKTVNLAQNGNPRESRVHVGVLDWPLKL